jgi:hypothetical protein
VFGQVFGLDHKARDFARGVARNSTAEKFFCNI